MDIDLTDIGIEEGQKYEGIYTTMSKDGVKNAAPIGIVCKGKDKLGCRLFVGTQTLKNIMETRKYVVNITFDPINCVNSTIGNLDIEEFTDDDDIAILKNAEAYIICDVTDIRKMNPIKDHVTSNGEAYIISSDVVKIVKNNSNNVVPVTARFSKAKKSIFFFSFSTNTQSAHRIIFNEPAFKYTKELITIRCFDKQSVFLNNYNPSLSIQILTTKTS